MTHLKSDILLLLTAAIWGFAFVAQRAGMEFVGPFTFNDVRFALGSISLIPLILYFENNNKKRPKKKIADKHFLLFSIFAGILLFSGATFQQIGLQYTTAGKAGFITGLYVVIVPFLSVIFKKVPDLWTFIGTFVAASGMYFLSINGDYQISDHNFLELVNLLISEISKGDMLVFICAFFFASHVILIGWLSRKADPLKISALQFAICSFLSLVFAIFTETITISGLKGAFFPILYGGLFSVGIAYTLQVVAQKKADPSHAAIILSLESVFAVIGGSLLLGEVFTNRARFGCALMLFGILLSQKKLITGKNKNG